MANGQLHPAGNVLPTEQSKSKDPWKRNAVLYEYAKESKPVIKPIPIANWSGKLHEEGPSKVEKLQLQDDMGIEYPATCPNCLANFVRVVAGESFKTEARATSQAFYIIRGSGKSETAFGTVDWQQGDVFIVPGDKPVTHHADKDATEHGGAALYWVHDEPLLKYLGVAPVENRFEPAHWTRQTLEDTVKKLKADPESAKKNRIGVLLGTEQTQSTKTLTHVLWALFNVIPARSVQKPHRHTATALDLAVYAPEGTYTMMARELDADANLVDPVKVPWKTGGVFVTPPGWWHSHHNDSNEDGWVLPMQDAGLFTYQRTLDIRFSPDEVEKIRRHLETGASFEGTEVKLTKD